MSIKYVPLHGDIKNLTPQETRDWLGGLAHNEVIRSIIIAEVEAIRAEAPREMRTLRGLWYEVVKPILSRLGILNDRTANDKAVEWARILSERLAEMVKGSFTSYEELKIIDGSRQRFSAQEMYAPQIDVSLVGGHYPWIILFTEKDTIWPVIENLATLYGVSAISGGGQPSMSCSENITREIIRSKAYQDTKPEYITILSLTDYDPAGYSIAGAQHDQILYAAHNAPANECGNLKNVKHYRLGLEPGQLTAAELVANVYEPKDKGLEEWLAKTDGVNGQPLGLELDSLPLSRLREMFALAIEDHIDISKRIQDLKTAFIDLTAINLLLPEFERQRSAMVRAAADSLDYAPVPSDIFFETARAGAGWISPDQVLQLFNRYQADIVKIMENHNRKEEL